MSKYAAAVSEGASAHAVAGLATAGSDASVYALVSQPSAGVNTTREDASVQVRMATLSLSHASCSMSDTANCADALAALCAILCVVGAEFASAFAATC